MQFEYLRYIVEVEKTRSISRAAINMHVSQPNISQGIKKIENELGIQLFERSRLGAIPTKSGEKSIILIQDILDKIEELKSQSLDIGTLIEGRVSIATIPSLSMGLLPRTISILKSQYPKLEINLSEDHSMNIIEKVKKDEVDIGLIAIPSYIDLPRNIIDCTFYMDTKVVACVGKESSLTKKKDISLEEIIKHPILSTSNFVINELKNYGEPKFLFKSKNLEGAKQAISEGLAIGFYTDISVKYDPYIHMGRIIPLTIKENSLTLSVYGLQLKRKASLPNEKFLEEFQRQINKLKDNQSLNN